MAIRQLQDEAVKCGGSVTLVAGNHENAAITLLADKIATWQKFFTKYAHSQQFIGIVEFMRFVPGITPELQKWLQGAQSVSELAGRILQAGIDLETIQRKILGNMRKDETGLQILEQMAEMRLVEQIDDTLFLHTELTDDILKMLEDKGNTVGESVDSINAVYQEGLRHLLLGEGTMPEDWDSINRTFTKSDNRYFKPRPNQLAWLKNNGVNYVVHGHTKLEVGQHVTKTGDGVTIIGIDHHAGITVTAAHPGRPVHFDNL